MKPTRRGAVNGVIAAAIVLIVALSACIDVSGSILGGVELAYAKPAGDSPSGATAAEISALKREGLSVAQAGRAIEAQNEISAADLVERIETALGRAFGGVWFESSSAQLHLGVTSPRSKQTVAAIAAKAGLATNVTETPVRSTWARLGAVRDRWDRRLADLFAAEKVATFIAPDDNSVEVELASSVSAERRAALVRKASAARVNVSITTVPRSHLRLDPLVSRCNAFAEDKAYCNKPIVAGVTIRSESIGGKRGLCTAGPAILKEDLSKETTETFLLTAGHCIKNWGGVGGKWYAFNKAGEEKEIGTALEYVYGKVDIGVIEVKKPPAYWAETGLTPVDPMIAPWAEKEPEPFPVEGETAPAEGNLTCYSGQSSGEKCATIQKTGLKIGEREELVEVKTTGKDGDSGAPFSSGEEGFFGLVEGVLIAEIEGSGNLVFDPLKFSLEQLKTKFKLLTQANKKMPACP